MDALSFTHSPTLNRPIMLLAFMGWNDAGTAATFAAKFLLQRLAAQKFASLDPETFYNFVEQRPTVKVKNGVREISWPANEFSYARIPGYCRMSLSVWGSSRICAGVLIWTRSCTSWRNTTSSWS